MYKNILTFLLLTFFAGVVCAEETSYNPTYLEDWAKQERVVEVFFMYPGSSAGIRYEMKIDDTLSAGASINYNFAGNAQSYGARVECNFYPQAHALNAWFAGPFAGVYNLNTEFSGPVFFSLGAQAGYRWIFDFITVTPRVMIQYGLGYEAEKKIWAGAGGFIYAAGLSAGYAF
jgi:hypothetical protein